ncbi:unnamed protein product [Peronospora effusa]|nr:unnamed protein product [Peronospora effusa]
MSVRREVVSLSQLLRRNENSNPRRGPGHAPPLPLQTSRRLSSGYKSIEGRPTNSAPLTERPASSRHSPLFTQCVGDANRASTSQPESSQTNGEFSGLSQEAYEAESVQLSAMTSMSQSSGYCQTQSQNLLGSSQDDQLHRLQQCQAQQAPTSLSLSPIRCNGSDKLQEFEQNLTKTLVEQTNKHKQQQEQLVMQLTIPIKESMEEINTKLVTCGQDQQKQGAVIGELAEGINNVKTTVSELREQSRGNKAVCEEARKAVFTEAEAVKAALTSLQARVNSVEGSVESCCGQVAQVLEVIGTKHEVLLSAVVASSCNCPQDTTPVKAFSSAERATKKRRPNLYDPEVAERNSNRYDFSSVTRSPARSSDQSPMHDTSLHLALQQIEALRAKRRSYLRDY